MPFVPISNDAMLPWWRMNAATVTWFLHRALTRIHELLLLLHFRIVEGKSHVGEAEVVVSATLFLPDPDALSAAEAIQAAPAAEAPTEAGARKFYVIVNDRKAQRWRN